MSNSPQTATRYNDRDLIESIVGNFFIVDYGYITKVNSDKTVNVTHCTRLVTRTGEVMPETTTQNLEVLTVSGSGFSFRFDYAPGDKVLLLGMKNQVKHVAEANQATPATVFFHYTRETMKALPLCAFSSDAKIKVETDKGTLKVTASDKIELNGNSKQFVTWSELNSALQSLLSSIKAHTHTVATTGTAAAQTGTAAASTSLATVTLDLTSAKTTTVVTGG